MSQRELALIAETFGTDIDRSTAETVTKTLAHYQAATAQWPEPERERFMESMRLSLEGAEARVRPEAVRYMAEFLTLDQIRAGKTSPEVQEVIRNQSIAWDRQAMETRLISRAFRQACGSDESLRRRCSAIRSRDRGPSPPLPL